MATPIAPLLEKTTGHLTVLCPSIVHSDAKAANASHGPVPRVMTEHHWGGSAGATRSLTGPLCAAGRSRLRLPETPRTSDAHGALALAAALSLHRLCLRLLLCPSGSPLVLRFLRPSLLCCLFQRTLPSHDVPAVRRLLFCHFCLQRRFRLRLHSGALARPSGGAGSSPHTTLETTHSSFCAPSAPST